jgi:hypothetical protein
MLSEPEKLIPLHGGYRKLKNFQVAQLVYDVTVRFCDRMVELVEQMLAARKQLAGAQSDKDKDFYTNRCDGLDRQIDGLVYDLYALTPAEFKIVEASGR